MLWEVQDVLRHIWRRKVSTLGLVLLLGLSTAIFACAFSVAWTVLWKPLPFKDESQLVSLTLRSSKMGIDLGWSAPYLDYIRRNTRQLKSVLVYRTRDMQRSALDGRAIELLATARMEPEIFSVLGVSPLVGRNLHPEDAQPAAERVVIVSETFWHSKLQRSEDVIGRKIALDGEPYTIVGVMPKTFSFPSSDIKIWSPYALGADDVHLSRAGSFGNMRAIARLSAGSTHGAATSELTNLVSAHEGLHPIAGQIGLQFDVKPIRSIWVQDRAPSLLAILTAAAFLLAVAVSNAYSLYLVRQLRRRQEFALLEAVGESAGRRFRRVAIEAGLIVLASTVVASFLMPLGLAGLAVLDVLPTAVVQPVTADYAAVALLAAIGMAATLALASTAFVFRNQLVYEVLRQSGVHSVPGRTMVQKKLLVICQIAAVYVLLFVTVLLMKSSYRLLNEPVGFVRDGAVIGILQPAFMNRFQSPSTVQQDLAAWLSQVSTLPGVESVGFSTAAPYGETVNLQRYLTASGSSRVAGSEDQAYVASISPGYVQALGLRLLAGRSFTSQDDGADAAVAIVDRMIAEEHFPDGAIGRMISIPSEDNGEYRQYVVVGVVDAVRQRVLSAPDEYPTIYLSQSIPYTLSGSPSASVEFVVRGAQPEALLEHITRLTESNTSRLRVSNFVSLEQRVAATVSDRVKLGQLLQLLSVAAMILAAAGLYALLAHMVISRGRELAIRKALGAKPSDLLADSLLRGLRLVGIGALCGLPLAFFCASLLRSRLYETSPFDVASALLAGLVVYLVGLVATLRPAISAARADPMDALRAE